MYVQFLAVEYLIRVTASELCTFLAEEDGISKRSRPFLLGILLPLRQPIDDDCIATELIIERPLRMTA
jgi:hypothetical protein